MVKTAKANPEDLVKAIRRAAREMGCNQSEERFQEVLFAIGTSKLSQEPAKRLMSFRKGQPSQSTNALKRQP